MISVAQTMAMVISPIAVSRAGNIRYGSSSLRENNGPHKENIITSLEFNSKRRNDNKQGQLNQINYGSKPDIHIGQAVRDITSQVVSLSAKSALKKDSENPAQKEQQKTGSTHTEGSGRSNKPEYSAYLDSNIGTYRNISKFSDLPQEFGYNQHIAIDDKVRMQLRDTLWKFKAPIRYAFAYGSGVFSQGSASYASGTMPQVDLIFGVSHTEHWHSLNMKQYPNHYSSLRQLGSGAVSLIQDHVGAGVYFNPFIEMNGMKIKYGVVNIDTLLNDLQGWETLYLAGRLHKPVKILRDEPKVRFVNQANLISVLRTSLLLLPEKFTELELYKMIAGISYMGDFRMQFFGENPNKVTNIVTNQFLNFRKLYSPLMDDLPNLSISSSPGTAKNDGNSGIEAAALIQDMDPVRRGNMVVRLPSEFRSKIYARYSSKFGMPVETIDNWKNMDIQQRNDASIRSVCSEFDRKIASDENLPGEVSRTIRHTVAWPSLTQSAKGILTAGIIKSLKYSSEKISKYRYGKNKST